MKGLFRWSVLAGLLWLTSCESLVGDRVTTGHLAMGNPSGATAELANADNYLMAKPQYVLSYNNSKGIPNWVSWQLNRDWLGAIERQDNFRPDDTLPEGWNAVTPGDYRSSGYDRGHMVPSGDRTSNEADNSATFLMTNIIPQSADNNRGAWRELEEYSRELVDQGKELYIIAGGVGQKRTLAKGKVSVPASTWKVIVILDQPGVGTRGVTAQTPVIAVNMPNKQNISGNWRSYLTTVDQLEALTGYDFLSNVSPKIQAAIESRSAQ